MSFCRGTELPVIQSFWASSRKCALVTSEEFLQSRSKIMEALETTAAGATVLFRGSRKNDISNAFLPYHFRREIVCGENYAIRGLNYQIDLAFDQRSWALTSNAFQVAILFPIYNVLHTNRESVIKNLLSEKKIGKVFLVSDTDNDVMQCDWLHSYVDIQIHLGGNKSYTEAVHAAEEME